MSEIDIQTLFTFAKVLSLIFLLFSSMVIAAAAYVRCLAEDNNMPFLLIAMEILMALVIGLMLFVIFSYFNLLPPEELILWSDLGN